MDELLSTLDPIFRFRLGAGIRRDQGLERVPSKSARGIMYVSDGNGHGLTLHAQRSEYIAFLVRVAIAVQTRAMKGARVRQPNGRLGCRWERCFPVIACRGMNENTTVDYENSRAIAVIGRASPFVLHGLKDGLLGMEGCTERECGTRTMSANGWGKNLHAWQAMVERPRLVTVLFRSIAVGASMPLYLLDAVAARSVQKYPIWRALLSCPIDELKELRIEGFMSSRSMIEDARTGLATGWPRARSR